MDLTPYVSALREDLLAAAAAGDEQTQRIAALLAGAIEPAARLALMNALSDLASEVTASLGGEQVVEVRLDGREVRVVVADGANASQPEPPPAPSPVDPGDISRITLRLVEQIKSRAEEAANAQGMSLNAWIAQAVQGALQGTPGQRHDRRNQERRNHDRGRNDDRRLRGWVQG